jgi:hypothetical protein
MSPETDNAISHWQRFEADVPASLEGVRVLDIGPAAGSDEISAELAGRGADSHVVTGPGSPDSWGTGFELVVCREALQGDAHPANLLTAIWNASAEGAKLLLHSLVMTDAGLSAYARFVAASAGVGDTEWLPGRLALRWTIETSAFDVERWIDAGADGGRDDAYLVATRTQRIPSLILATPVPAEPEKGRPDGRSD